MATVVSVDEAVSLIKDGDSVMIGGFMGCGSPHQVIAALVSKGTKHLTVMCNDGARPEFGVGQLISNGQVKKLIATHIGLNPEVAKRMDTGELQVELIPQGTFAECIRCGGNGMGGFLTPTGLGTIIADGKKIIRIDGKDYLLELPLTADVALINGNKIDTKGNIWYRGATRNFNVVMATAAALVIAEADHIVELGEIEPENVATQGIFVDYIVKGGNTNGRY
ncbi:acetyl-CoA:acetoacetyl-CoA transferase subunit alpha [Gammaproteobacteria bacterium]